MHLKLLLVAAVLLLSPDASAEQLNNGYDDAEFCEAISTFSADTNAEIRSGKGVWADSTTQNLGMYASCVSRLVSFKKKLHVVPEDMRVGWQSRKQAQWNDSYCRDEAWIWRDAVKRGWIVRVDIVFLDGQTVQFDADCS